MEKFCDRCPHYVVCPYWRDVSNDSDACFFPSDSAVKQILLTLDERPGQSFIIEDLDEFHVLVRSDEEQRVKRELEAEVCSPTALCAPHFFFPDGDARSWRRIRIAWKRSCRCGRLMCCYYWRCDGKDAALQAQGDIAFLCVGSEEAAVSLPIWLYTGSKLFTWTSDVGGSQPCALMVA